MIEKIFDNFSAVCADFADAVNEKKYKKVDYNVWRCWSHISGPVCVTYNDSKGIYITNGSKIELFSIDDGSLGEFLYDTIFKEEKEMKLMADGLASTSNETAIATKADKNYIDALEAKVAAIESKVDKITDLTDLTGVTVKTVDGLYRPTYDVISGISEAVKNSWKADCNNKEKKKMKNFNFDFGKVMDSQARVSMYGIAVKSPSGSWVAYDKKTEQMMDVDILNFEGMDMLYKMPVAINQVAAGDVIIHMGKPCFVVSFNEEGKSFNVIDIFNAEEKSILPVRSPFGFNFVTKLVSLIDFTGSASADQPFGNTLPFLMMKDGKFDEVLPFMLMSQGSDFMSNPMAMMLLMDKNSDNSEMIKMMAMAQMFNQKK